MVDIRYDNDADLSILSNKTVAIIGYGSQGHAHALNLRDSGVNVVIGLRDGSKSTQKALDQGLKVLPVSEATKASDIIMILAPDQFQKDIYTNEIEPNLKEGAALAFAHGFNIRFGYIKPNSSIDVFMVAPKGPGHTVRREFEIGRGVPVVWAVEQNASGKAEEIALAYAKGIGGLRAGGIKTTFTEEAESDLFGEQAVLCGGVSKLIQYGFETLTEAGYQNEIAYFEVCHELKLIVDLIVEGGISKQRWSISDTAEYGDYISGPRVITPDVKKHMQEVLKDIQDGTFAKRFMEDQANGAPEFKKLRLEGESHPIEKVGKELRKMYSWKKDVDQDYNEGSVAR